jgi:hypothetical protein
MKNNIKNELVKDLLKSKAIKFTLYGAGAIAVIYLSGIVMRVLGKTAQSYKFMSDSFK